MDTVEPMSSSGIVKRPNPSAGIVTSLFNVTEETVARLVM